MLTGWTGLAGLALSVICTTEDVVGNKERSDVMLIIGFFHFILVFSFEAVRALPDSQVSMQDIPPYGGKT